MSTVDQLLTVCDRYCEGASIARSRLSTVLFSRGTRLDEIAKGGDIGSRLLAQKMQWLSGNWPDGCAWPEGVDRPAPKVEAVE